jgi:outer membrane protein assembly factor BamB
MKRAVIIAVAGLAVAACVGGEANGVPIPTELEETVQSERVADGVTLEGDASGRLPVRVAWVVGAPGLEATATDGAVVFIVGDGVKAIRARDGRVLWKLDPWRSGDPWLEEFGLGASGGVVIGLADGGAVVRVFAPWEYDIELDRTTGRVLRSGPAAGGDPPQSRFDQLPPFAPSTYRIDQSIIGTTDGRLPSGELAFRLREDEPMYTEQPPVEVSGVIVLGLTSGHVVALRPAT